MKNNIQKYIYFAIVIVSILCFTYIILFASSIDSIYRIYPDSNDYALQSKLNIFSSFFFNPKATDGFTPRPFIIPFFYSMVNADPIRITYIQKILYLLSTLSLIFTTISFLRNMIIKIISMLIMLYFFTWWNILGWTNVILSESISMSLLFFWLAIILLYFKNQSIQSFLTLVFFSFLLSFTRDTWPYVILTFSIIMLALFYKLSIKKNLIFVLFSIILFFIQDYTSSYGERYKIPLFNSIVGRISNSSEHLKWFKNEGMPLSERVKEDFKNIKIDNFENRELVYSKYNDTIYRELFNWIKNDGKSTYKKFLITHPNFFFLINENNDDIDNIFCTNLYEYTYPPSKNILVYSSKTFPYFNLISYLFITLITIIIAIKQGSNYMFFPLILLILFGTNALITYNADALEVKRHLFITQIIIEFSCLFSVVQIIDIIFNYYNNRKIKNKAI